ncbi:hypothetical protein A2U01_0067542, partial [Trifolium medium]|nr:hypothetical protein [Trifolium medium]
MGSGYVVEKGMPLGDDLKHEKLGWVEMFLNRSVQ